MARKSTTMTKSTDVQYDRQMSFRAPAVVQGALKQIVGRLEMVDFQIDGKQPTNQDILNWLVGELYAEGPSNWPERVTKAHDRFKQFTELN